MVGRKGSLLAVATALLATCGAACSQATAGAASKVVSGHEEFQSVVTSVSSFNKGGTSSLIATGVIGGVQLLVEPCGVQRVRSYCEAVRLGRGHYDRVAKQPAQLQNRGHFGGLSGSPDNESIAVRSLDAAQDPELHVLFYRALTALYQILTISTISPQ